LRKGDEIWVRWSDGTLNQLRLVREGARAWDVVWLTGQLKTKEARIEKQTLRELIERREA